ncbi:nicotinate-nucleotide pyrophosphorylase [carboxylating] [Austwickia chelonae]|uniref:Nicotinate-nucleotide pyrophosphorylase [carboxylating] n=1 Tax=Austwickia chelonae NBRC 105200 TaxID=1184607 RepID=K6VLI6_9MICO|nr:carboxylating nicotinate-nucleotide diphosphorylase [Austwickia chelonae]GAB77574.1 nicotinate-nucleotide pyrophosphorylase [Austwickia chelonae NBRC 105200]SEW13230.1 nicotinate-nucleotide pyrophosphorylase [carboxylating] [Austwickia chelonae]
MLDLMIEPTVRAALLEDLGRAGDLTTEAIIPAELTGGVALVSRDHGILAGTACARIAWQLVDPTVDFRADLMDSARLQPGSVIGVATGPVRALLTGERVALNFLGHLSGIATTTAAFVEAVAGTRARVCCTRKTTPGLRAVEKAAVRAGGGANHRYGLDDAVLIKDNHLAFAGSITRAVRDVRSTVGHLVKVEVEVDRLDQVEEVLAAEADAVLLDNMSPAQLRQAVELVDGQIITEASGRVTPQTVRQLAETGVDLISVGWLTHSAPVLDIGLDYLR